MPSIFSIVAYIKHMWNFIIDTVLQDKHMNDYIAIIVKFKKLKKEEKTKRVRYVRVTKEKEYNAQPNVVLQDNEMFMFLPNLANKRSIIYATGASGAGKTYLANEYCEIYKRLYPNRTIKFFTCNSTNDDPSLNLSLYDIENIYEFIDDLQAGKVKDEEFKDSLIVIDDIKDLDDKSQKIFWRWLDRALECFRRKNTSIYVIAHLATNYKQTRLLIKEAQKYVIYPENLEMRSDRVLTTYYKLPQPVIYKIFSTSSRWVCIFSDKSIVMTQNELYNIPLEYKKK